NRLLPSRSRFIARAGLGVSVIQFDGNEAVSANDLRRQNLGLRAKLRPLDDVLGQVAVDFWRSLVAIIAPAGCHKPVLDLQAKSEIFRAGLLVQKAPALDAADVAFLGDGRGEGVGFD